MMARIEVGLKSLDTKFMHCCYPADDEAVYDPAGLPPHPRSQSGPSSSNSLLGGEGRSPTTRTRRPTRRQATRATARVASRTGQYATSASPLFDEYVRLLNVGAPTSPGPIGPDDALVVVDMQRDFVPLHSIDNPDGGRFGVPEGDHIVLACVQLIEHFVARGGYVAATRDYHPHDHASFLTEGGHFPVHCVQGTRGSYLMPEISQALARGKRLAPDRVHVAFKAMHEDVDSFGGLPYINGGHKRIITRARGRDSHELGCQMGCAAAPWTGSLLLKQSGIAAALADKSGKTPIDMDCPPDAFACVKDSHDRNLNSLHEVLKKFKRVFVCGLALDFCVLDTCVNGSALKFKTVAMVLDAARAAHIPGLGLYGSGFLSDPKEVVGKIRDAGVSLVSVEGVTGTHPYAYVEAQSNFPNSLGPFAINTTPEMSVTLEHTETHITYRVTDGLRVTDVLPIDAQHGRCSPIAPLPAGWPGAPDTAVALCWAHPMEHFHAALRRDHTTKWQLAFLSLSASGPLQFALYGGWLLLDARGEVICVQSISIESGPESEYELIHPS